jgi:hypothetical protein
MFDTLKSLADGAASEDAKFLLSEIQRLKEVAEAQSKELLVAYQSTNKRGVEDISDDSTASAGGTSQLDNSSETPAVKKSKTETVVEGKTMTDGSQDA